MHPYSVKYHNMKRNTNDHPTNQRVGMKRGIQPLQLLDGVYGSHCALTLFVVEVLQPAFFSEALFLRVPVPCQMGADITHPPSVSFRLTCRCSEGANGERVGREHSTPPLAMSFSSSHLPVSQLIDMPPWGEPWKFGSI